MAKSHKTMSSNLQ